MRPQVQALLNKLRKMEMMKQPGTAEEVIYDIAYVQLYSKQQEVRMAKIAARLTHLWISMRGNEDIFGPPEPQSPEQVAALPALATETSAGDRPDLDRRELKDAVQSIILDHRAAQVTGTFTLHCRCGRNYDTLDEWSKHLRIRIWNTLKNEFPPIGSTNE